jgi:uncharacterized membrane protein YhaH (DUF805 family)
MVVLGGIAAALGCALFHIALAMTLRRNPDRRIPWGRNAAVVPAGSVMIRAIGAGLIVLGTVGLATAAWYWAAAPVLVGPVAALVVIVVHNARVDARRPA